MEVVGRRHGEKGFFAVRYVNACVRQGVSEIKRLDVGRKRSYSARRVMWARWFFGQ
jgi:hypothetical protein